MLFWGRADCSSGVPDECGIAHGHGFHSLQSAGEPCSLFFVFAPWKHVGKQKTYETRLLESAGSPNSFLIDNLFLEAERWHESRLVACLITSFLAGDQESIYGCLLPHPNKKVCKFANSQKTPELCSMKLLDFGTNIISQQFLAQPRSGQAILMWDASNPLFYETILVSSGVHILGADIWWLGSQSWTQVSWEQDGFSIYRYR